MAADPAVAHVGAAAAPSVMALLRNATPAAGADEVPRGWQCAHTGC
eukprot:gene32632-56052_t